MKAESMNAPAPQGDHLALPKYRKDIDGLRAVAVLSVVLYHAFPKFLTGGFIGVDIFFVISGFLISTIIIGSLEHKKFSFLEFYARRVRRIFPALLLVLGACLGFGWFALMAGEYAQLGKHAAAGAGFISNLILWNESGYFDAAAEVKPLLHLWSLGIEEQFYLLWPLALWFVWKRRINPLTMIFLIVLASFGANIGTVRGNEAAAFYSPLSRFWELLLGAGCAYAARHKSAFATKMREGLDRVLGRLIYAPAPKADGAVLRNVQSLLGLALIGVGLCTIARRSLFPGWNALLPTAGAALLIMAGEKAWINRKILGNRACVGIGLISYPLYLWHWPLLSFARIVEGEQPPLALRCAAVTAALVLACLTYVLVERPIRFGKQGRAKAIVLFVLMAIMGGAGLGLYGEGGMPARDAARLMEENNQELVKPPQNDEACAKYMGFDSGSHVADCRLNDIGADETIALLGDSHAYAAFTGAAEIFAKQGKNTLALAPCPPFSGRAIRVTETRLDVCEERFDILFRKLSEKKDIKNVFLFSRGAVYLTGIRLRGADPEEGKRPKVSAALFSTALQNTIDALSAMGKKVYYITENPDLAYDPALCIHRPFRQGKSECTQSEEAVRARQESYLSLLPALKNVTVIDVLPAFCPNGVCSVFDRDGRLMYADDDHLSVSGSRFQAEKILAPYLVTHDR
jgi:peptidoglycan/LPS O-acetylase OafA/YrhL